MSVSRGKPINITDYRESYPNEWRDTGKPFNVASGHHSGQIYIAAPSFVVLFSISKHWFASISMYFTIYKWNGQLGFTEYKKDSMSYDGSMSFSWKTQQRRFIHNKDDESYDYHDNSDIHLWKIVYSTAATGDDGNLEGLVQVWAGGIEVIPQTSTYNYMWKTGSKLHACRGEYFTTSDYSSDISFIDNEKPDAFKTTPIYATTAKYAYSIQGGN